MPFKQSDTATSAPHNSLDMFSVQMYTCTCNYKKHVERCLHVCYIEGEGERERERERERKKKIYRKCKIE